MPVVDLQPEPSALRPLTHTEIESYNEDEKREDMQNFQFRVFANLMRALFPNWNFFDRVGHHFELEFKISQNSAWERVSFEQRRGPLSLFLNPDVNLAMAQVNILEHFVGDLQELQGKGVSLKASDLQSLVTFKMLISLMRVKIREFRLNADHFQFKILACSPSGRESLYISDWVTRGEE